MPPMLLPCPECGNEISDKAVTCPHCGAIKQKARAKRTYTRKTAKDAKPNSRLSIIAAIIVIGIMGIGYWIWDALPQKVHLAKPIVLNKRMDDKQSGMLKQRFTVYSTISNEGEAGKVAVTFYLYQAGKTYEKLKSIHMKSGEKENLQETFEGLRLLDGTVTFDVKAKTQ